MKDIIWVGHRESEIYNTNIAISITSWGSNCNGNISYCKEYGTRTINNKERSNFIVKMLKTLLVKNNYKVMFYSPTLAYSLMKSNPELKENIVCLNTNKTLKLLNDKITTRLWMSKYMPVLPYVLLAGKDCHFINIKKYFSNYTQFVIQDTNSSGGLGTFLMNNENYEDVFSQLEKEKLYLVSYYVTPSFSTNVHILVADEDIIVFPGSVQIIEEYKNNLIYSGADFVNYKYIKKEYKDVIYSYAKQIGSLLKGIGYKGICGIDFLVNNDRIYFVEINPRFQASTILLNLALNDVGLPSIQELQVCAFNGAKIFMVHLLEQLDVEYSLYKYKKEYCDNTHQYLEKLILLEESLETQYLLYDGCLKTNYNDETYLYQVIWKRHISSCGKDGILHLHPNVPFQHFIDDVLPLTQTPESLMHLKIALLNQGVRILPEANSAIGISGGYNESVFNSLDLILFHYLRINAPVNINLCSISPFAIGYQKQKYILYYYSREICEIELEFSKSIENLKTQNGIPYKLIAFISGDRLRIKPEPRCFFKTQGQGCMFCPGNKSSSSNNSFDLLDIKEVIDYCVAHENFRHILIGGGSADPSTDENNILPVVEYIRSKTNKPIYLMCLPPNNINYVDKYIEAGITEIAFNIELFDRGIALEYMPGKGRISLEEYIAKLERATCLISQKGNVRTMLMAGLEKKENTLSAIKLLAEKGIQPMISIYRPTPNNKLSYIVQPSNEDLYSLYQEAMSICQQYDLFLGPSCPSCQNNTLAITLKQD